MLWGRLPSEVALSMFPSIGRGLPGCRPSPSRVQVNRPAPKRGGTGFILPVPIPTIPQTGQGRPLAITK